MWERAACLLIGIALSGVPAMTATPEQLAAALRDKGEEYEPRTEHLLPDGSPKYPNRLIFETSPYLLQHAHNPVDWYAWGDEPFERARADGKLVLLSVGRERSDPTSPLVADYVSRIAKFLPIDNVVLKPAADDRIADRMLKEARRSGLLVALDERGRQYRSPELAELVAEWMNRSYGQVTLVIGGADGLPERVRAAAGLVLGLSKMTLPHRLARLVLVEQLYRALCIVRGVPYQK